MFYDAYICICNYWPLSVQCFCVPPCMICVLWYVFAFCKYLCLCVHCFCNLLCVICGWLESLFSTNIPDLMSSPSSAWPPKTFEFNLGLKCYSWQNKQRIRQRKSQFNVATDQENIMIIFLPHQQILSHMTRKWHLLDRYAYGITQMVECSALCELPYTNNIQS